MSSFDEKPPFKKRIVSASLTHEQRDEFDRLKEAMGIKSDGTLIKRALSRLSKEVLTPEFLDDLEIKCTCRPGNRGRVYKGPDGKRHEMKCALINSREVEQ